jgi:uncharacterized protein (TIGR02118 family)
VIKTLAFLVRRPDLSRAVFARHYEEKHVPLALPQLGGLVRYVRNHLGEREEDAERFDALTEFWYASAAEALAVAAVMRGDAGAAIRADELEFMDKPRNRSFAVEERVLRPAARAGAGAPRAVAIALFEPGARCDFAALAERELPRLLRARDAAIAACTAHRVLATFTGSGRPLASVVTLSPRSRAALGAEIEAWARARGARSLLWGERFETPEARIRAIRRSPPAAPTSD